MEDNTLFECRYEYDEGVNKEYLKFIHFRMPSRIVTFVICLLFVALMAAQSIYYLTIHDNSGCILYWALTIVLAAFYLYLFINRYRRDITTSRKRRYELYGNSAAVFEYSVNDKEIKSNNLANHQEITVPLASIVKLYETENLIILKSNSNLLHIFTKSGFTKGTPDEFIKFMHSIGCR